MAVATRSIIEGTVIQITVRDVTSKAGDKLKFTNVLVVGDFTLCDATLGRDVGVPKVGDKIRAQVEVSVFRDEDQIRLLQYI